MQTPEEREAYRRAYREKNRELIREKGRVYQRRRYAEDAEYRERMNAYQRSIPAEVRNARGRLNRAVKRGEIKRPDACEECGKRGPVEAAHVEYISRINVRWLCPPCHRRWDDERGRPLVYEPGSRFNHNREKTHCQRGHPYDEANTWLDKKRNSRHCRACHKERQQQAKSHG